MALGRIGTGLIEEIRQPEENTKRINRRTFVLGAAAAEIAAPSIARAAEPRYMPGLVAFLTLSAESLATGDIAEARLHFDRAIALYSRRECRPLARRFGVDANEAPPQTDEACGEGSGSGEAWLEQCLWLRSPVH
jgi:hypothetical protein